MVIRDTCIRFSGCDYWLLFDIFILRSLSACIVLKKSWLHTRVCKMSRMFVKQKLFYVRKFNLKHFNILARLNFSSTSVYLQVYPLDGISECHIRTKLRIHIFHSYSDEISKRIKLFSLTTRGPHQKAFNLHTRNQT